MGRYQPLPKRNDRIRLISMGVDISPLEPGTEGWVRHANEMAISVDWDNGRRLGLIPEEDEWEIIS